MHYELYIDVFFLINFMMDYLLLCLLQKMLSAGGGRLQRFLGALMGAGLTCLVVVLRVPYPWMKLILYHGVIGVLMLKTGLNLPFGKKLLRGMVFLYIGSILMGGVMQLFRPYLRVGSLFFALALLGYFISQEIWTLLSMLARHKETEFEVRLYLGEKSCILHALYDTGNHLREEQTHMPVNIIRPGVLKQLGTDLEKLGEEREMHLIPYQSIGENAGMLPAFYMERLCLDRREQELVVKKPLIAVCNEQMDSMDYDMILNPDCLKNPDLTGGEQR